MHSSCDSMQSALAGSKMVVVEEVEEGAVAAVAGVAVNVVIVAVVVVSGQMKSPKYVARSARSSFCDNASL